MYLGCRVVLDSRVIGSMTQVTTVLCRSPLHGHQLLQYHRGYNHTKYQEAVGALEPYQTG